jgi:replicative DNA helicase
METKPRDRTPPHDNELERAVLGSMLFDPDVVKASVKNLQRGDFYSRAHQRIFEAVLSLNEKNLTPDVPAVIQELKQTGKLDEAGGAAYVDSLTKVVPSSANIEYYVQSVLDHSFRRRLLRIAGEIGIVAYAQTRDSQQILENNIESILSMRNGKRKQKKGKKLKKLERRLAALGYGIYD